MKILLCGADGFLGRHLETALVAAGHQVRRCVRTPRRAGDIAIDYRHDLNLDDWLPRLAGIDAVINAVGILNQRRPEDFERIHHRAPAALFAACAQRGIGRVIQISALGAQRRDTPYLASKAAADDCLLASCPTAIVLRPSLVFGLDGASSRFFLALASLPAHFLPGAGAQPLRPIHVADLAAMVVRLLEEAPAAARIVDAVGGQELPFSRLLSAYRAGLGLAPAFRLPVPAPLMAAAARLGDRFPASLLNRASWAMLQAGSSGDASATARLLGHEPRPPASFVPPEQAEFLRLRALAAWRAPLIRAILAFLWLWSAAVSLLWPATGLELLVSFNLAGPVALAVLVAASALDAGLGLLTLLRPGRRLWQAQIGLVVAYSGLVAWRLPEYLIHPFAPIAKNLAMVVLLLLLWSEEKNS